MRTHPKTTGPLLVAIGLGLLIKSPILILICLMVVIVLSTVSVVNAISSPKQKRRRLTTRNGIARYETPIPAPKVVNIAGVGEIQWITDIRQLENQCTWNRQQIKQAEQELLDSSPLDWRKEGEEVVLKEEGLMPTQEVPLPATAQKARKYHDQQCRCQDCWRDRHSQAPPYVVDSEWTVIPNSLHSDASEATLTELLSTLGVESHAHEVTVAEREEPVAVIIGGKKYSRGGVIKPDPNSSGWRKRRISYGPGAK